MREAMRYGMSAAEFYDSTPRELSLYFEAKRELMEFTIEQGWDYVRHIMVGSLMPYSKKTVRPSDVLHLKRDHRMRHLSGWEQQEMDRWSKEQDEIMKDITL